MKKTFRIAFLVLTVALVGYGVGRAQSKASQAVVEYETEQMKADFPTKGNMDRTKLAKIYMKAPQDPEVAQDMIRGMLIDDGASPSTKANAMIIAQNQEIIRLLKQRK